MELGEGLLDEVCDVLFVLDAPPEGPRQTQRVTLVELTERRRVARDVAGHQLFVARHPGESSALGSGEVAVPLHPGVVVDRREIARAAVWEEGHDPGRALQ